MQILPIDVTALVATVLGLSLVLIPVLGFTARFPLNPTAEALRRIFDQPGAQTAVELLERRVMLLEQRIEDMEGSVSRIAEVQAFHAALEGGDTAADPPTPASPAQS